MDMLGSVVCPFLCDSPQNRPTKAASEGREDVSSVPDRKLLPSCHRVRLRGFPAKDKSFLGRSPLNHAHAPPLATRGPLLPPRTNCG